MNLVSETTTFDYESTEVGNEIAPLFFTVGILTRNSAQTIADTLKSIVGQSLPPSQWQCIVVDHDSIDGTRQIITDFVSKSRNIFFVSDPENNLAKSRQKVVEWGRADWIAFVDSDVVLPPNWLEKALRSLQELKRSSHTVSGVGAPIILQPKGQKLACLPVVQTHFLGHFGTEQMSISEKSKMVSHLPTAASVISREAIISAGGFDPEFGDCGEDLELGERLSGRGHTFWIIPDLKVSHQLSCSSRRQWLMRAYRFGKARMRVAGVHFHLWRTPRLLIPVLYAASHCGLFLFSLLQADFVTKLLFPGLILFELLIIWFCFIYATSQPRRFSAAVLTLATHHFFAFGQLYALLAFPFTLLLGQRRLLPERV